MSRPTKQEAEKTFREVIKSKQGFVLGNYVNTNTKILLQCKNNHQWEATPAKIKVGRWCPKCKGCCPIQAKDDFEEIVRNRGGIIMDEYIDTQHPIEIKCSQGKAIQC